MPIDPHFPEPDPGLDEAVRAHLDAEAARTDPHAVWGRVCARLGADAPAPARRWPRVVGYAVAAAGLAAAVLIAVSLLAPTRQAIASPAEVVAAARDAQSDGDRCYTQTVTIRPEEARTRYPVLADPRPAVVCTRGNQFVVEPGFGGHGAWGRDDRGRVWIAPTRDAAARFDDDELPPALREAAAIRGLELRPLLDQVLADFDLVWGEKDGGNTGPYRIAANRRGEAAPFQVAAAALVIDRDTKLVRTLTLSRSLPGGATATVRFDLNGTVEVKPEVYTAEGHTEAGAPVYDRTRPFRRLGVLAAPHLRAVFASRDGR